MSVERLPRGKFTREFWEEAVRKIIEEKMSIPEVGRRLQLPPSTIRYGSVTLRTFLLMRGGYIWQDIRTFLAVK